MKELNEFFFLMCGELLKLFDVNWVPNHMNKRATHVESVLEFFIVLSLMACFLNVSISLNQGWKKISDAKWVFKYDTSKVLIFFDFWMSNYRR